MKTNTKRRTLALASWNAVTKQLVSDVPLCCFLSGGLDSSIISAIASEQYRKKGGVEYLFGGLPRNREHFQILRLPTG